MAGRRVAITSIDWAKIAARVSDEQKQKFLAFRAKSDSYLRRMNANPESPPKIDWAYYKHTVPVPGMVDNFQKQYESMMIPFPADTATPLIDAQEQQIKKEIEDFKAESNKRITTYKTEAERIRGLLPYEQMTMEDFRDAHPDLALDPINRPTFWPHTPEEQLGYTPKDASSSGGH
uniref:ATP synthase subunit d, mitochondrial n=1 Tax=Panstrongylus megistus TaxID=65343 RepID=A0A069DPS4_9HEMI